jgi:hypothetical protein
MQQSPRTVLLAGREARRHQSEDFIRISADLRPGAQLRSARCNLFAALRLSIKLLPTTHRIYLSTSGPSRQAIAISSIRHLQSPFSFFSFKVTRRGRALP